MPDHQNRMLVQRWDEVCSAASSDPIASAVKTLGERILAKAGLKGTFQQSAQKDVDEFCKTSVTVGKANAALFLEDILTLYHKPGDFQAAWLTDGIVSALMENEFDNTGSTHFQPISELMLWLSGDFRTKSEACSFLKESIAQAEKGEQGIMFPIADLSSNATRILIPYNPSGAHWVVIEASFPHESSAQRGTIKVYNPLYSPRMISATKRGRALAVAEDEIPLLLHLASLRPGSKLQGPNWREIEVEMAECPQQSNDTDCALYAMYVMVLRGHDAVVTSDKNVEEGKGFGMWLRKVCAQRLAELCAEAGGETLWQKFGNGN